MATARNIDAISVTSRKRSEFKCSKAACGNSVCSGTNYSFNNLVCSENRMEQANTTCGQNVDF
jgi:hypothetical protein